jgi:1-pyrroline-5-carboxylate dehydrogenase
MTWLLPKSDAPLQVARISISYIPLLPFKMQSTKPYVVHSNTKVGYPFALDCCRLIHLYEGQKCSALSRLYVSSSVWKNGFKDLLVKEVQKIKVGDPTDFQTFNGPVMYVFFPPLRIFTHWWFSGRPAFDRITGYIEKARKAGAEVLAGGTCEA